jgi:hypothetical protein
MLPSFERSPRSRRGYNLPKWECRHKCDSSLQAHAGERAGMSRLKKSEMTSRGGRARPTPPRQFLECRSERVGRTTGWTPKPPLGRGTARAHLSPIRKLFRNGLRKGLGFEIQCYHTAPKPTSGHEYFRLARHSERFTEALRSVAFLSFSALLLGTSPFPTPSRELLMVLPGGCLSALLADASRANHFGEGVQRTIPLLRHFRHVIFLSQILQLSHRLAFFFLCRPVFPNRIIGPCAWLPLLVLRRRQYIWGRPDWCASA